MNIVSKIKSITAILACTFVFTSYSQTNSKFIVALDAGHGAHDFGAVYNGHIEKKIALAVVLKVGKILEKNPHISGFLIIRGEYEFRINDSSFKINVFEECLRNLFELFEYVCFVVNSNYSITGKFSHFERIDDQIYRIHMKK